MTYLLMAFIAVWLLVTLYMVYITQRQRSLEQDLRALEDALAERGRRATRV